MSKLEESLHAFAAEHEFVGKGPLSLALVITRRAQAQGFPLDEDNFVTPKGGQVRGLGKSSVQAILRDYGISRVLAEEGGRTSRGSIERMRLYLKFLNNLEMNDTEVLEKVERWWVARVEDYFASQPIRIRADDSKSLTQILREVIDAAFARQRQLPGTMIAGAVMQHLVGAKLELALPSMRISHNGFSVADAPSGRRGDFLIADTVVHVTTAPSEALVAKCRENLAANKRPLIITTTEGVGGASALARSAEISERVDVLDVAQFLATNIFEWSKFAQPARSVSLQDLIGVYNRIVSDCETDPNLRLLIE